MGRSMLNKKVVHRMKSSFYGDFCENTGKMHCYYSDSEHCSCPKCFYCKDCTNGSQIHRNCLKYFIQMDRDDTEISELVAGPEERLPTEAEETEAESLRRNTPISMQYEEMENENQENIFHQIYRFETVKTDIDIAFPTLTKNYPNEDFTSSLFQRMDIHKYLSDQVTKKEFFIANNQWGIAFANYNWDDPVRMRKGVITKFDKNKNEHRVFHKECKENCNISSGYTRALLTVETSNVHELFNYIISEPDLFLCGS